MRGHGCTLDALQDAAIAALIVEPTQAAAAKKVGIDEGTLRRWQQIPTFRDAWRAARRVVVEHALALCQQASSEAVETLRRGLTCGAPAVELRAAQLILEQATKGVEIIDLQAKVEALEQVLLGTGDAETAAEQDCEIAKPGQSEGGEDRPSEGSPLGRNGSP